MMIVGRYHKAPSSGLSLCRRLFSGLVNDSASSIPNKVIGANNTTNEARLLLAGPDASGIVASFSHLLFSRGCGIVDCTSESSETDTESRKEVDQRSQRRRMFFQRILFDHSNVSVERNVIEDEINDLCVRFGMKSQLSWGDKRRRIAIFVSKYDHCLWELVLRQQAGELDCEVAIIISNHEKLRHVADTFGIPYIVFPITKENKLEQEKKQISLMEQYNVDLLVLARYMQVLSPSFCARYPSQIINIHHSFLPAFRGGAPYHKAHQRGVKLVGATAHYATTELDEGPIIEQDIMRVSHRDDVKDLIRKGRTLEKTVLTNAVKAHLDDRIITHHSKCIVFAE